VQAANHHEYVDVLRELGDEYMRREEEEEEEKNDGSDPNQGMIVVGIRLYDEASRRGDVQSLFQLGYYAQVGGRRGGEISLLPQNYTMAMDYYR